MRLEVSSAEEQALQLLGFQVIAHDRGVVLKRGSTRLYVEGERIPELINALVELARGADGIRLSQFLDSVDPALHGTARSLFAALNQRRLLIRAENPSNQPEAKVSPHEDVFYWSYGSKPEISEKNLADVNLAVIGVNHISTALVEVLHGMGFCHITLVDHPMFRNIHHIGEDDMPPTVARNNIGSPVIPYRTWVETDSLPSCLVVTSDFGGFSLMREWNNFCFANDISFYPIVLQDQIAFLGPMVLPNKSPCFECLWRRQNANMDDPDLARSTELVSYFGQKNSGFLPAMARAVADIAAIELLKLFSQVLPGGNIGKVIEIEFMEPSLQIRKLLKAPRCPVCSGTHRYPTPAADISIFLSDRDSE